MSVSIFRVGRSNIWHYRFQVAGVRTQRSTRLSSKTRAAELAEQEWRDAVTRANGGQPVPTLAELFHDWLVVHRPVVSAAHYRSVEVVQRLHLYKLGEKRINAITTEEIELARNLHLQEHKPATANHWLRVLKLVANWAVKRKIIPAVPWRVAMLKVQKRPRAMLPLDIAMSWFEAVDAATARDPSVATAIRLMFGLGLREGESAGARWEWMDWERATYTPGETKGREAEPVPVPAWLLEHLRPLRQQEGLIAPRASGSAHPAGFARRAMRLANARCKIKGVTPHRLRGTFATLLSEQGVPIQTIQAVLRHKSPLTTMAYLEKNLSVAVNGQAKIATKAGLGPAADALAA